MPSNQSSTATPAVASKSKSRKAATAATKSSLIIKLKVSPEKLRKLASPSHSDVAKAASSSSSSSPPNVAIPASSSPPSEIKAESTPVALTGPTAMLPPTEAVKKKAAAPRGTKRNSSALGDTTPKPRGKPGPKKKPRLEDGTIDHTSTPPTTTTTTGGRTTTGHSHKLGPKANQGAINAGLRALDRSGKPCRKWQRGSFKLKSFTGVVWEIPRWRAPAKTTSMAGEMESSTTTTNSASAASGAGSGKENGKGDLGASSSLLGSDKSIGAGDVDGGSLVSSPAPVGGVA